MQNRTQNPKTFIPKISKKILYDALKLELEYLRKGIKSRRRKSGKVELPYQVYAVLTTCRIFYTFNNGAIVSKQQAANWCIKNLPEDYRKTIEIALKNIFNTSKKPNPVLNKFTSAFMDFIDKKIN